ncbi:MAG TPA: hypothetical protein VIY53_10475 [Acidobacteriaceae bacterium]
MAKAGMSVEEVFALAADLPGVERSESWGSPALKMKAAGGKLQLVACVPTHKSAEPGSLMFRIDRRERGALVEEDSALYYVKPHYEDYDAVLVRLERLRPEVARDLLRVAWRFVGRKRGARG